MEVLWKHEFPTLLGYAPTLCTELTELLRLFVISLTSSNAFIELHFYECVMNVPLSP